MNIRLNHKDHILQIEVSYQDSQMTVKNALVAFGQENGTQYADAADFFEESEILAIVAKFQSVFNYQKNTAESLNRLNGEISAAKLAINQYQGNKAKYMKGLIWELQRLTELKDKLLPMYEAAQKDYQEFSKNIFYNQHG